MVYYVVVRPWGFMEVVRSEQFDKKGEIMFEGTEEECNKIVHGQNKRLRYTRC